MRFIKQGTIDVALELYPPEPMAVLLLGAGVDADVVASVVRDVRSVIGDALARRREPVPTPTQLRLMSVALAREDRVIPAAAPVTTNSMLQSGWIKHIGVVTQGPNVGRRRYMLTPAGESRVSR